MIILYIYIIIIIFIYFQILYFLLFIVGNITNKYKDLLYFFKNKMINIISFLFLFNKKIYFKKKYKVTFTNKVDIVISNHYNILDLSVNGTLLNQFSNKKIHYILNETCIFHTGGIGITMNDTIDTYIYKDFNKDQYILKDTLSKINDSIIIIYLEGGMAYHKDKYEKSIKYCKEINIKPFKNLLCPRITGIWFIMNELKKQNKLGNLIDLTTKFKFKHPLFYEKLINYNNVTLSNTLQKGDLYFNIQTYNIDKYDNLDEFKKFIFNIWREKDTKINDKNYKLFNLKKNYTSHLLLFFIAIISYGYLIKNTYGSIILITILVIYIKNKKVINKINNISS